MKKPLVLVGALAGGMILGAFAVGYVVVPIQTSNSIADQNVIPGQTGRNASGQTYGPLTDLSFQTGPDLFEAGATNGRLGYVETSAFAAAMAPAGSLDAAITTTQVDRTLPVYAVDGKTVIGEFLVSAGKVGET
jgi:hypothetical protein